MIESMHIENFKCFKDFDIELGKFNVLIGPNDSGKTAFLQAIRLLSSAQMGRHESWRDLEELAGLGLGKQSIWRFQDQAVIFIGTPAGQEDEFNWSQGWVRSTDGDNWERGVIWDASATAVSFRRDHGMQENIPDWFDQHVGESLYLRLDPRSVKKACELPASPSVISEDGEGLAGQVLAIAGEYPSAFQGLRSDFQSRFGYEVIARPVSLPDGKAGVAFSFKAPFGELSPESVSDGVVLSLAYMAMTYLKKPPRVLLVEEPENGVHHGSLKEIVGTLKHLSEEMGVQVIATTHSPYLLDLIEPEEVRVFAKDEEGAVHAAKLSDYPEVEKLRKHFMTGELWTEFDEADIVKPQGGGSK